MRNILFIAMVMLLFSCGEDEPVVPVEEVVPVHVFFAGGQSNARPNWADGVASALYDHYKDSSAFIVLNINHKGQPISKWADGVRRSLYYDDYGYINETMYDFIKKPYVLRGMLWFQGESDADSVGSAMYKERFTQLVGWLKEDFGVQKLDVVLALIDMNQGREYDSLPKSEGVTREAIDLLRERQMEVATELGGMYYDTRPYKRVDIWHMSNNEYPKIGYAMGSIMADLLQ
jgi:hypothetical protein